MELWIFFSSLSIFIVLVLIISHERKKPQSKISTLNQPPGPPKLPFIGNLHQLLLGSLPHHRLTNLAKTYGPLMHLQLGQLSTVVVSSPEIAEKFLKDFDINFSERGRASVTDIVTYNRKDVGFSPYGEYWRQVRKISILHLLSAKRVQMFESVREEEVSNCITLIYSKVGSPVNLSNLVFSLMNSIVERTVIGWKNRNEYEFIPLMHRYLTAIAGFGVVDMFPSLEFIHIIMGMKSRLLKLQKDFDTMFQNIINEHKAMLKAGLGEANNLLDVLLELQQDLDSPLTTDSIKGILLDMFVAGTDTSATVIEWVMSELMKNPIAMRKAQEEVRKAYVKYGKFDQTALHELDFLKAVVKEVLRLHPPVTLIPRQCREECTINGYNINVSTEVLFNVWAIGRDPNYWIEPEKFYPERFLESGVDYKGFHYEFIPFGGGRRMCPGLAMGIANAELPLAELLCHFEWKLPDEMDPQDLDMKEKFSIVVRRRNDLYLIPTAYQC